MKEILKEIFHGIPTKAKIIMFIFIILFAFYMIWFNFFIYEECGIITEKGFKKIDCEQISLSPYALTQD